MPLSDEEYFGYAKGLHFITRLESASFDNYLVRIGALYLFPRRCGEVKNFSRLQPQINAMVVQGVHHHAKIPL
jgi:hypothetical protein